MVIAYVLTSLTWGGTWPARLIFYGLATGWGVLLWFVGKFPYRAPRLLWLLEITATNLAATLVLAEGALRLNAAWTGRSPLLYQELDAYRLVPGVDYGAGLRGNRLGYPGRDVETAKRAGVFRIAALGDSFAVGPTVPFPENYLSRLEQGLPGVEVDNFGVSGTGPREYQAILQRDVWQFQPDLVLVSIFVGNDVTETLATPRHLDPRRHAVYLLLTRAGRLIRERWRQEQPTAPAPAGGRRLEPGLSPATFREVEARRLAVCCKGANLEKKWRLVLMCLDRIIGDCRRHQVPVGFILIPDEFQVNATVLVDALRAARLEAGDIELTRPQQRFQEFFVERGVPCLDLLPVLRTRPDTYTPHDTHWNVEGNRVAAEAIRRWLVQHGLTPGGRGEFPAISRASAGSPLRPTP